MTEAVFIRLKDWIEATLGSINIVPTLIPETQTETSVVSVYLRTIVQSQSTAARPVKNNIQMTLSYLICAQSKNVHEVNDHIARLTVAAMTNEDIEIETKGLSPEEWRAFGMIPRPCLVISVPLNCKIETDPSPIVKKPIVIQSYNKT